MEGESGVPTRDRVDGKAARRPRGVTAVGMDRNRRLAGRVFDHLRDDIVRGVLLPGTPMAELDLCSRLGVSRTPVREALIKLAEGGLVRIYPQRGTFVAPISVEACREAQFIREHLECALVGEAVRRIDATGLRQLHDIIDLQQRAQRTGTPGEFYDLDERFHNAIACISGHARVWHVIMQVKVHFDRVRYLSLQDANHIPLLISQHGEIVDGLANCDEVRAMAAMRRHLREVFRTIETMSATMEQNPATPLRRRRVSHPEVANSPQSI
jgi:DNA-binding GntR family transcriptional regulator